MKLGTKRGLGIKMSDEKRDIIHQTHVLPTTRLMLATSLKQLKRMIADQKKTYRSARTRNQPRRNKNPDKPENNQNKRNRHRWDARRDTPSEELKSIWDR